MFPDVLDEIRTAIGRKRKQLVEYMAAGSVQDYPAYRELAGQIKSLDFFMDTLEEIEKKYIEE